MGLQGTTERRSQKIYRFCSWRCGLQLWSVWLEGKTVNLKKDSVHGDVRYTCDQCDYKAARKGQKTYRLCSWRCEVHLWSVWLQSNTERRSQKTYIDSVHRDVRYTCNQCDYKAKQKVNFNRHIDSVHGDVR